MRTIANLSTPRLWKFGRIMDDDVACTRRELIHIPAESQTVLETTTETWKRSICHDSDGDNMSPTELTESLNSSLSAESALNTGDFENANPTRLCVSVLKQPLTKEAQHIFLERDDIVLGRLLGRGSFCEVKELRAILPPPKYQLLASGRAHATMRNDLICDASDGYRFAVKQLAPASTLDMAENLLEDLHNESRCLQALAHPNIIRLRAVASERYESTPDYFIVVDRLYDTLQQRITKWRLSRRTGKSILERAMTYYTDHVPQSFMAKRLLIAYDLADAIAYIHRNRVMHRDIKASNIAFDVHDDIKIFDFGLARELNPDRQQTDGTYQLTGMLGSLRYMSPEVMIGHCYNEKADVYSYALVLWEMLALEQPFKRSYGNHRSGLENEHIRRVCHDGHRPAVRSSWGPVIWRTLECGWAGSPQQRYGMDDILGLLRKEVLRHRQHNLPGLAGLKFCEKPH